MKAIPLRAGRCPEYPVSRPQRWLRWVLGPPVAPSGGDNAPLPCELAASTRDSVLLIDASGSMALGDWQPSRLEAAQEAAEGYVDELAGARPDARIAVIAFGSNADIKCDLTAVDRAADIKAAIRAIDLCGDTNLSAGLTAALEVQKRSRAAERQVVVLTDGESNRGDLVSWVAARLRARAVLECVGIGGSPQDVNERLLKSIASKDPTGRPRYRWIGDKRQLVDHYRKLAGRITRT